MRQIRQGGGALEPGGARRGTEQTRENLHRRALSRAIRAQEAEHLARTRLERHVLDGDERTVVPGQPIDGEHERLDTGCMIWGSDTSSRRPVHVDDCRDSAGVRERSENDTSSARASACGQAHLEAASEIDDAWTSGAAYRGEPGRDRRLV